LAATANTCQRSYLSVILIIEMRREWIIYLVLLVMTAAVYWPVGHYDFVNCDDPDYVAANPHVQQGLTPAGVAWALRAVVASNWHPLTLMSLMLDCQLFGNHAGAHHLVNVAFHLANTLLLFLVWRRMTGELWPSALVAALFAWHPLHVESVAWIAERKDVLSTFFGLLTLLCYVKAVTSDRCQVTRNKKPPADIVSRVTRHVSFFYWLALFFFALALMSKPMLVTWPFVLLLLDFWPLRRISNFKFQISNRRLLTEKIPFFALAAAESVVTFWAQHAAGATELLPTSLSQRIGNALVSYVRYLGKMIWPEHLAFFYPYPGPWIAHEQTWAAWQVAGAAVLLAVITMAAVWQARRRPFFIAGWLWFLGTLVPVIGLVQVGGQSMADRYTYIPLIGVFVMIAWGGKELGGRLPQTKLMRGAAVTAALAACLVATSLQLRSWQNSETLYRHAIAVIRNNYKAHYNLGLTLLAEGKTGAAIAQMKEAVAIVPGLSGRVALAQTLVRYNRIPEAIEQYREFLHYNPSSPEALNNLAWLLATNKDPKIRNGVDAVQFGERLCGLTDYKVTVYVGTLAAAYAEAGRFDDAIHTAETAIALASAAGQTNLLEKNRQLLELYRAGRPYREGTKL